MPVPDPTVRTSAEPHVPGPAGPISRRQLLGLGITAAAGMALPAGVLGGVAPAGTRLGALTRASSGGDVTPPRIPRFVQELKIPPVLSPSEVVDGVDFYDIEQRVAMQQILPPPYPATEVWGYNGMVPGPTIRQHRHGNRTVVRNKNSLPEPYSTHLHGSPSQPIFDGHPEDLTYPGETKVYKYPNDEDGRTLWYHDHAVHLTAEHVYKGLAGFFIQEPDPAEVAEFDLDRLPSGEYDVPLMFSDMQFTANGTVFFDDDDHKDLIGNVNLVNGVPWPVLRVATRKYRFRFLVASVSRGYVFSLSNGMPFTMIGTDSCLREAPVNVTRFRQGMAERYEVVIDFSALNVGDKVTLLNLAAEGPMRQVMQFVVDRAVTDTTPLPTRLYEVPFPRASDVTKRRYFLFERENDEWVINGKPWDFARVDAAPRVGDTEKWILENKSGGWFHPVHIHLVDFQVLRRNGRPPFPYERGLKDVVYVGPNERVEVLMTFHAPPVVDPTQPTLGRYVMHCHNLVHEDHDMMNQFELGAGATSTVAAGMSTAAGGSPHRGMMMLQWELQA
jgi:spore coat protein A, manganese oxidase